MANKAITSRDVDFAKWYTDVVTAAHLADYSNVKGCTVFEPNGYALWEKMQQELDKMFKRTGHKNVYMPLLIPENLLKKEGELIDGFAPEVAWVTIGGQKEELYDDEDLDSIGYAFRRAGNPEKKNVNLHLSKEILEKIKEEKGNVNG